MKLSRSLKKIHIVRIQHLYPDAIVDSKELSWASVDYFDEDCVDTVLREFYHLSDDMIARIKTSDVEETERYVAYEGGNYVRYAGNVVGDLETHEYKVTSVMYTGEYPGQIDGVKYLFEYEDNVSWPDGSEYMTGTGYAIMEYKEIDGTYYWTVYESLEDPVY